LLSELRIQKAASLTLVEILVHKSNELLVISRQVLLGSRPLP
jgi:hypothetical protein